MWMVVRSYLLQYSFSQGFEYELIIASLTIHLRQFTKTRKSLKRDANVN